MPTPRPAVRPRTSIGRPRFCRIVFLLFLPACHTWRSVELAPDAAFGHNLRLEGKDQSTRVVILPGGGTSRQAPPKIVLSYARVVGDSLVGVRAGSSHRIAVALTDVRRAQQRRFNTTRTTLLVVGAVGVGALVANELQKPTTYSGTLWSGTCCGLGYVGAR